MPELPTLFIGSSSEGKSVAQSIRRELSGTALIRLWDRDVFTLNSGFLEALMKEAEKVDFAILVLTPDDMTESRDLTKPSPRDNVIFELGLFLGKLGRSRTFYVYNKRQSIKIPTDLLGIQGATFENDITEATDEIRDFLKGGKLARTVHLTNPKFAEFQARIIQNTIKGLDTIKHDAFHDEVYLQHATWAVISDNWGAGKLVMSDDYEDLLVKVFEQATKTIFSTSVPDYRRVWISHRAERLLKAHKDNTNAKSCRVFIFETREDVLEEDKQIFQKQQEAGIEVLVYYNQDHKDANHPVEALADWALIDDGKLIAVTKQFQESLEATWHFDDEAQAGRYRSFRRKLKSASEPWEP